MMMITDDSGAERATVTNLRRRGVALSSCGIERFHAARKLLSAELRANRHPTLTECALRAKVGLRTLTRCLRGERVDRRSVELIFIGVGLELGPSDVAVRDHGVRAMNRPLEPRGPTPVRTPFTG